MLDNVLSAIPGGVKSQLISTVPVDISAFSGVTSELLAVSDGVLISSDNALSITLDGVTTPSPTVASTYVNGFATIQITKDVKKIKMVRAGASDCNVTLTFLRI